MTYALTLSRALIGIDAPLVKVETHITGGVPRFNLVGLPETAVRESTERVRSAIINSNFDFFSRRITVNLAPADLPKESTRFDLAIALGVLAASRQIKPELLDAYEFIGELALSGELRPVTGVLPMAIQCQKSKRKLIVAKENAEEASLCEGLEIYPARSLLEVYQHLRGETKLALYEKPIADPKKPTLSQNDFAYVHQQAHAKRALQIAAAGGHHVLMFGPPGTGKTMLANCLPSILPPLTHTQALEIACIYSSWGQAPLPLGQRPFRSPHHSASSVAIVGGGRLPKPGEISLAHHGVLFLDEFPEFTRPALEALREPLESGFINVARASYHYQFPAQFQLIATMNPCPCGYYGDPNQHCSCSQRQISNYLNRLSGPLLDRIDVHLEVATINRAELYREQALSEISSERLRQGVDVALKQQRARNGKLNCELKPNEIKTICRLDNNTQKFLQAAAEKMQLSLRAFHRSLRVARTIADLDEQENISIDHLSEALSYRKKFSQQAWN